MRFKEIIEAGLTGVKRYHEMNEYDFESLMYDQGFEMVGSPGSHARVYRRGKESVVYKVYPHDACYDEYLTFIKTRPNPHYPKIYGSNTIPNFFKRPISRKWGHFRIVKIEYVPRPMPEDEFLLLDRIVRSSYLDGGRLVSRQDPDGDYATVVAALYDVFNNVECSPDMTVRNFGKRQDGTIVILDPIWEGETPYAAHDRAMRAELDFGDEDEDPEYVSGPWTQKREKAGQKPPLPAPTYDDDDMPF